MAASTCPSPLQRRLQSGGLPEADSDESVPRLHVHSTISGLVDGNIPPPVVGKTVGSRPSSWRLPPMSEQAKCGCERGASSCQDLGEPRGAVCQGCRARTVPLTGSPRTKELAGSAAKQDSNPSAQRFLSVNRTKTALRQWAPATPTLILSEAELPAWRHVGCQTEVATWVQPPSPSKALSPWLGLNCPWTTSYIPAFSRCRRHRSQTRIAPARWETTAMATHRRPLVPPTDVDPQAMRPPPGSVCPSNLVGSVDGFQSPQVSPDSRRDAAA